MDRISDEYEFVLNDYFQSNPQKIVIPNEFDIQYVEVEHPRVIEVSLDEYSVKNSSNYSESYN